MSASLNALVAALCRCWLLVLLLLLMLLVVVVAADVFRVECLQRELPVAGLPAAAPLGYVRIVPAHRLGLEHLKLGVDPL